LWHWQINLRVAAVDQAVRAGAVPWSRPGVAQLPEQRLGFTRALMARDPDGHALLLRALLR
jgi:hypothetical protein